MCGNGDTTGSAVLWPSLARLFLFMTTSQLDMKEVLMNRLLLVFVAMLLLVVTSTIAGPEKIVFPSSYKSHVRYATVDRPDNKTVREVYISPESAKAVNPGEPLPHG